MLFFHNDQVIREKLPVQVLRDGKIEIQAYDIDNLYPQRMEQLMLKSPLVSSAVKVLTDFINGDGFANGADIVNEEGQSVNDVLDLVSKDLATFNGYSLLLDFNGLGQVANIQYLPFAFVRYGKPDKFGRHSNVKVSNNWENNRDKGPNQLVQTFKLFDPLLAGEDVRKGAGGSQVLYITNMPDAYPLTSFDAVADAAQTDAELQTFELNTVSKGFAGVTLLKVPGGWEEGSQEEDDLRAKAASMSGARGGGMFAIPVDDDSTQTLLENVNAENKDRLFVETTKHVRDIITQNYNQPGALSGVNPEGGVFTQQAYKDAFLVYNAATKNARNRLERAFEKVLNLWHTGPIKPGKIVPQKFDIEEEEKETPIIPIVEDEKEDEPLNLIYGTVTG